MSAALLSHAPLILAIESSCDETAVALLRGGEELLASVVASQIARHQEYGGVVPELAAREHLRNIRPVMQAALREAGLELAQVDAVAVTQGPGLAGALLVGITYAKALSYALGKPLIAVNHLEGHIHAVMLEQRRLRAATESGGDAEVRFPLLALVVSGGHTHLYLIREKDGGWTYVNVGRTRDDAAGEAFDKVAKLLGLGYPGGPIIDFLAPHGDAGAVPFGTVQLKGRLRQPGKKQPERAADLPVFDFSYSGIKTAVLRYVETQRMYPAIEARQARLREIAKPTPQQVLELCDRQTLDLVASFQRAMVADIVTKTVAAIREFNAATLFVTGGVAANSALRVAFTSAAAAEGTEVFFPSRAMSTDNAAMIAAAAYPKFLAGQFAAEDVSADAGMLLPRG